jgi:hypothetical protein
MKYSFTDAASEVYKQMMKPLKQNLLLGTNDPLYVYLISDFNSIWKFLKKA